MDIQATVGRTVHFYDGTHGPYAAIVSGVSKDDVKVVHLHVFYPYSTITRKPDLLNVSYESSVSGGGENTGKRWCWPPKAATLTPSTSKEPESPSGEHP